MRVPITDAQARAIGKMLDPSQESDFLSNYKDQRAWPVERWVDKPRTSEGTDSLRKIGGIQLYLALSAMAGTSDGSFPAEFHCLNGKVVSPDKATIKVWMRADLLRAHCDHHGRVEGFSLTEGGRVTLCEGQV